jgi:hypothetical protein
MIISHCLSCVHKLPAENVCKTQSKLEHCTCLCTWVKFVPFVLLVRQHTSQGVTACPAAWWCSGPLINLIYAPST